MPNRYVREDAIESERVNALSWQGEVFYRRLINRADDFGRYTASPSLLLPSIFPLQINKVSLADIGKLLLECEEADLISRWKGEAGKEYLVMHTWEKGRAKFSKYPDPPARIREHLKTFAYGCKHKFANVPDSDSDSDSDKKKNPLPPTGKKRIPAEVILRYWKSKISKDTPTAQTLKNIDGLFHEFDVYDLITAVQRYRDYLDELEESGKKTLPYKGSNFFGRAAYFRDYLPTSDEKPELKGKIDALLEAA